jgi:hypothetical protein
MFFRSREFVILGSLGPAKSRIRECAEFGNLDSAGGGVTSMREPGISTVDGPNFGRIADSGTL